MPGARKLAKHGEAVTEPRKMAELFLRPNNVGVIVTTGSGAQVMVVFGRPWSKTDDYPAGARRARRVTRQWTDYTGVDAVAFNPGRVSLLFLNQKGEILGRTSRIAQMIRLVAK